MNYYDFLTKRLAQTGTQAPIQITNPISSGTNPFLGNIFNPNQPSLKLDGNSIFTSAKKEDLDKIDYSKFTSKKDDTEKTDEEKKLSPLEFVIKEFLSLDKVKDKADDNRDGDLTIDEIKDYIKELVEKDGNAEDLSLEDFEAVIKELGIDLEELSKPSESGEAQATEAQAQTTDDVQPQADSTPAEAVQQPVPTETPATVSAPAATAAPSRSYTPAGAASSAPKTLDNMSLEELQAEKTTRVATQNQKQNAVNAVHNNENENVKAAKADAKKAQEEYEKAIQEDPGAKKFAKDIIKNNQEIEKNQQALNENAIKIIDTELKLSEAESSLEGAKGELSSLEASLSALSSDDKNKDKVKSLKDEISAKKKEISKKEKDVKDLKKSLEKLNKEKEKLEKEKTKLEEKKAELDAKVKQYCSEETKAKLEAFNKAKAKVNEVKSSELSKANSELTTAKTAVAEVNKKINEAKATQSKNKYSNSPTMKLSEVSESFKKEHGVTEKTLPDGTKVLACRWSRFNKCQEEWLDLQQHMLKAADDLGLTLVYSDVERTVAESNTGRAKKGALVCRGGESPHNYGVAADIVLFKNGQAVGVDSQLQTAFAQKVKEYSGNRIEWGGDWRKKGERHHFNVMGWEQKYKNPYNLVG